MNIAETVTELVAPIVEAAGLTLWDVEYKKEGADYCLRVYIDKPDGVSIDDCERINNLIDPILDEKDPIPQSYLFEVSSAGLVRELRKDAHLSAFIGKTVSVRTYKSIEGLPKRFDAVLEGFDDKTISLCVGGKTVSAERSLISGISIDLV